jgi:hypothetical protein
MPTQHARVDGLLRTAGPCFRPQTARTRRPLDTTVSAARASSSNASNLARPNLGSNRTSLRALFLWFLDLRLASLATTTTYSPMHTACAVGAPVRPICQRQKTSRMRVGHAHGSTKRRDTPTHTHGTRPIGLCPPSAPTTLSHFLFLRLNTRPGPLITKHTCAPMRPHGRQVGWRRRTRERLVCRPARYILFLTYKTPPCTRSFSSNSLPLLTHRVRARERLGPAVPRALSLVDALQVP